MGKKLLIGLGIIIVLLGAGAYMLLAPAGVEDVILYRESGTVEVYAEGGWQPAEQEMILYPEAMVRTGEGGRASLVFLEGEVMSLEPNTEVKIDEITGTRISLSQNTGETWNKVTKISGIKEYSVQTPNTVATVRGTAFLLTDEELEVAQGNISYENKKTKEKIRVPAGKKILRTEMKVKEIPKERIIKHQDFRERYVKTLQKVREREVRKHKTILKAAEKKGYSEEEILKELKRADEGKEDIEKAYAQVPGPLKGKAKRTYELTKEIRRAKAKKLTREEAADIKKSIDTKAIIARTDSVNAEAEDAKAMPETMDKLQSDQVKTSEQETETTTNTANTETKDVTRQKETTETQKTNTQDITRVESENQTIEDSIDTKDATINTRDLTLE